MLEFADESVPEPLLTLGQVCGGLEIQEPVRDGM